MKLRTSLTRTLWLLVLVSWLAGCNLPSSSPPAQPGSPYASLPIAEPLPPQPETIINFHAEVPNDTPPAETVYLTLLDEVTGLALNAKPYPMQLVQLPPETAATRATRLYIISLPFAIGSVVKYRYERTSNMIRVGEHTADGSPVRYRLFNVQGPATVEDVVSRWTDTTFNQPSGRISGRATDASSGAPVPNLLVTAGGAQTITTSDGSFLLEGLPPGVHNLVALALDGSYSTFQQGARVAPDSTTPAPVQLTAVPSISGIFIITVPKGSPPAVPVRLAGNLYTLGNTFATLTGGMSSMATNMPVLEPLPDGRYRLTLSLPVGADIRYKYTLGDGFWNAEHRGNGEFRLRQIVVPPRNFLVEEIVETWHAGSPNSLTFDVTVPADTPQDDFVSIQFNPLFGWTEPIPMWKLGSQRWGYILYSPLNLPGNFNYRYCRNNQCGTGDDAITPGLYGQGRPLEISPEPKVQTDQVNAWADFSAGASATQPLTGTVTGRGASFWAGVEFQPAYHPSWRAHLPQAVEQVRGMGANWLVLTPTWSFGQSPPGNTPPVLAAFPGYDMLWFDLEEAIQLAQAQNLKVALFPTPRFLLDVDEWWQSALRDESWWVVWFEQYRSFVLHHADLAARTSAPALILGGEWVTPALPEGLLSDGSPSGVPADIETQWRSLLSEVRQHYSGSLLWALPDQAVSAPPPFLSQFDQVYALLTVTPEQQAAAAQGTDLSAQITQQLDASLQPLQATLGKPFVLALSIPADPDLQAQFNTYSILLQAIDSRNWISGFVTRFFYPPLALQDRGPSIHGKPASQLLGYWFPQLTK